MKQMMIGLNCQLEQNYRFTQIEFARDLIMNFRTNIHSDYESIKCI